MTRTCRLQYPACCLHNLASLKEGVYMQSDGEVLDPLSKEEKGDEVAVARLKESTCRLQYCAWRIHSLGIPNNSCVP